MLLANKGTTVKAKVVGVVRCQNFAGHLVSTFEGREGLLCIPTGVLGVEFMETFLIHA